MDKLGPFVIAADIGGSHITAALVDTRDWQIVSDSILRKDINSHADAKTILRAWSTPLKEIILYQSASPISSPIGIAMPGPFDYEQGISRMRNQDKYDDLYGMNIRAQLADRLAVNETNIRFINDAAAFLQGEVYAGKHNDSQKILGITLGTGLGSAVWKRGNNAQDADLWKTPYRKSNIEEYLVTRWFVKKAANHGISVTGLRQLLQLQGKYPAIDGILSEYSNHLLHFIQFFSEQEAANKLIIGGNISNAWEIFRAFNPIAFDRFDIHITRLGEYAALIGAASLFEG